ncbi:hypothetical protein HYDPIDRAFT_115477 [Hydnomerulius pinastri MD-312]|uniref:Unplaced genomic scaffold scaffold_26, whole genome shotgun sequence n=1 Tax=Hydnomerulius pinastri MD-312 TaxID=994086 RepID=A0A0C9WCK4_9AGAM|nr:hypothetical protein HYDPIDRAFT_115477 [Hydnomerulius pinastri MD-312]
MSATIATTIGAVTAPPTSSTSPPITQLLPLLQATLRASYSLLHLAMRAVFALTAPVYLLWPIILTLFSPITIIINILLDAVIFTPFSIIRSATAAMYPLYIFCAVACISGGVVGIFGRYAVAAILGAFARSRSYFKSQKPPPPSFSQTQRKRKRRSVRVQ